MMLLAKRRVWRKLHLAVDPVTHDIVAAEVSLENVHDAEVLPTLLNPLRRKLGHVYADGAYDSNGQRWLITSCRSANNIMPITIFLPAFIASFFYSA